MLAFKGTFLMSEDSNIFVVIDDLPEYLLYRVPLGDRYSIIHVYIPQNYSTYISTAVCMSTAKLYDIFHSLDLCLYH